MVTWSRACKLDNFESHNSLKLSFANIWGLCSRPCYIFIISLLEPFCRIGSPKKSGPPLHFNLRIWILKIWKKYCWIMYNALESRIWPRIWLLQVFEIEIQNGWANSLAVLQNWFPQGIRSLLFNLRKF